MNAAIRSRNRSDKDLRRPGAGERHHAMKGAKVGLHILGGTGFN